MSAKPAHATHHHHIHNAKGFVREVSVACAQRGLRLTEIRMQVLGLIAASEKPVKAYDLLDQLKEVYIEGVLDPVETAVYYPKLRRKDYTLTLNLQPSGPDPDQIFDIYYGCRSTLNVDGYCNSEVDELIEQQSKEADEQKRRKLVWALERKLAEDVGRPVIFYASTSSCWQPAVKGFTPMVNSMANSHRYEDIWLDR